MTSWSTWIFDCDGVLLDSNRVKTDAFRALGAHYGADVGEALVRFHIEHGGLSRFIKVRHLHAELLGDDDEGAIADDLRRFASLVEDGLRTCAVADGARELLSALPTTTSRFVVSGGLETEVNATLAAHGLRNFFSGVYGSPKTKDEIFAILKEHGQLKNAVFFGDARYDAEVAARFGVDFYFVARYSEWDAGRETCRSAVIETLADMVPGALTHG